MMTNGFIANESELADRRTLANSALNDVYLMVEKHVKEIVLKAPRTILAQLDFWTSNNGNIPYVTVAIQFVDNDFVLQSSTLTTEKFERPHTSQRVAETLSKVMESHNLSDKFLICCGDHGSNLVNLPNHAEKCISYIDCINHSIHLIFSSDMKKEDCWEVVENVLKKIKSTHGALCYQLYNLKEFFYQQQRDDVMSYLDEIEKLSEAIQADEDTEPFEKDENLVRAFAEITSQQDKFTAFLKPNATRWFSESNMATTYEKNFGTNFFFKKKL
jgi:hypothetical protein